ncbi:hypothetical protein [Streptomyces sp. NPDC048309]|uniref:hypothetical protein n=1 Tax=Streptomyces sp. NPDC048309 TaxID=3154618 RepID=UPI0033E96B69
MTEAKGWTIPLKEVPLIPERTLGTPPSGDLARRLSFGQDLLPVSEAYAPPEWCAYAAGLTPERTFRLLALVCSFYPEQPDSPWTMKTGSMGLSLSTAGETPARAVARRIDPGRRTQPVSTSPSTVSFSFNAGLFSAGVEHPVGGSTTGSEWVVQGYGAHQSRLRWDFRSTRRHPLVGDHPLAVLVELEPDKEHRAEVMFSVELKHPVVGLRRHRAQLPAVTIPLAT